MVNEIPSPVMRLRSRLSELFQRKATARSRLTPGVELEPKIVSFFHGHRGVGPCCQTRFTISEACPMRVQRFLLPNRNRCVCVGRVHRIFQDEANPRGIRCR